MRMCIGTLLLICIVEMYINFILGGSAGVPPPNDGCAVRIDGGSAGVPPPNDGCAVRIDGGSAPQRRLRR
jgi:hypothetical protein